ncbi:MAG: hypothetical protein JWM99_1652, partial [Verrucomicrobiales bacterium]|nr:hypothetical protein [Verrucomicrobiales bacterium]
LGTSGSAHLTVHGYDASGTNHSTLEIGGILEVGQWYDAAATIEEGGRLFSRGGLIGSAPGILGKMTVQGHTSGSSSSWESDGEIQVGGLFGDGSLEIKSGGCVRTLGYDVIIGYGLHSHGSVSISGVKGTDAMGNPIKSKLDALELKVDGTLMIEDGAGASCIGASIGTQSPGTVIISGSDAASGAKSDLFVFGNLKVGGLDLGPGTLLLNGGEVTAGAIAVGPRGIVTGNGTLSVDSGNRLLNGGLIDPGFSPGRLTINGNFGQTSSGVIQIEVGGLETNQFDRIVVNGRADLLGNIVLTFIDGYAPRKGDQFQFLEVTGKVRNQAEIEIHNLAPDFQFSVLTNEFGIYLVALNDAVFVSPLPQRIQATPITKAGITYLAYTLPLERLCRPFRPKGSPTRIGNEIVQVLSRSFLADNPCNGNISSPTNTLALGSLPPGDYQFNFMADGVAVETLPIVVPDETDQLLTVQLEASQETLYLSINGLPEVSYRIESSSNLIDWGEALPQTGSFTVVEPFDKNARPRFYRVRIGD